MTFHAVARRLVLSLTCLAALGQLVPSAGLANEDPPPLTGPEGSTPEAPMPIPAPIAPKPAAAPARPAHDDRPVLALPGVTTPPANRNRPFTAPLPPPSIAPSSDGGLPPLEMPGGKPGTNANSVPDLLPLPSDRFRSNTIESVPSDGIPPLTVPSIPRSGASATMPGRSRVSSSSPVSAPAARNRINRDEFDNLDPRPMDDEKDLIDQEKDKEKAKDKDKDKEKDKKPEPAPRRGFTLFNRWMPRPTNNDTEMGSGIKAEPRIDPAADAALKRRIERQANDSVGDRVRNVDVRVVGRSITIQAHGVKFLQRRTVKRSLESLPGLSGYRSIVEVLD